MAQTVTIPWGDGTDDNIYLTFEESTGDQEVVATFDMNASSSERSKRIRLRNIDDTKVCYIDVVQKRDGIGQMIIESTFVIAGSKIKTLNDIKVGDNLRNTTIVFKNTEKSIRKPADEYDINYITFNGTLMAGTYEMALAIISFSEEAWTLALVRHDIEPTFIWIHEEDGSENWITIEVTIPNDKDYIVEEVYIKHTDTNYWTFKDSEIKQN